MEYIKNIINEHEELYTQTVRENALILNDETKKVFFQKQADKLVERIIEIMKNNTGGLRFFEYNTLSNILLDWKNIYGLYFKEWKDIYNPLPTHRLKDDEFKPQKKQFYSDKDLRSLVENQAYKISEFRRMETSYKIDRQEDRDKDWYLANVFLAIEFIDGHINFITEIGPESYYWLENIWLKGIKLIKAYLIWKNEGERLWAGTDRDDYFEACDRIRLRLVNPRKGTKDDFEKIKSYLEKNYLTNGKLDKLKDNTKKLINTKRDRINNILGKNEKNEERAEEYIRMFYENIIPAVIDGEEGNRDNVLDVLKAFEFSKAPMNRYIIINCFEAAVAINFLNPVFIEEFWRDKDAPWERTL